MSSEKALLLDPHVLENLQILPRAISCGRSRASSEHSNSITLYSILSRCKTSAGHNLLVSWLKRPLSDPEALKMRLDSVAFFAASSNTQIMKNLRKYLGQIANVKSLIGFCDLMSVVGPYCDQLEPVIRLLNENTNFEPLGDIQQLMTDLLDFPAIRSQERFVVRKGFDSNLDFLKQMYCSLPDILEQKMQVELAPIKEKWPGSRIVYFPLVGFLIQLKIPDNSPTPEEIISTLDDSTVTFKFKDEWSYYFENSTTKSSPSLFSTLFSTGVFDEYGDMIYKVIDMETIMMHSLQERILASNLCSIALATATDLEGVRPILISSEEEDSGIAIKDGKHPMLKQLVTGWGSASAIGGSFLLGGMKRDKQNAKKKVAKKRIALLTGPNGSGKTVYMKMVGLLCYMAHVGCFVPAKFAQIPILDSMVTSFFSEGLSEPKLKLGRGYEAKENMLIEPELRCLSNILDSANEPGKELILLDEFIHGMDHNVSKAVKLALLKQMLQPRESKQFLMILSTHDHAFIKSCLATRKPVAYLCTQFIQHENSLVYQYSVAKGVCENSFCLKVAQDVGIPPDIIKRARQFESDGIPSCSRTMLDAVQGYEEQLGNFARLKEQLTVENLLQLLTFE
ncbi:MutS protein msh5 [Cichlidogyrus casuarinus]|uniref:MutS protein msh5 n=1 Tax=Cichlidogyrus casuarinus TaxID=1844966 RepID=A0ABD2QJG3_9PLAT